MYFQLPIARMSVIHLILSQAYDSQDVLVSGSIFICKGELYVYP